ncbi:ornithine cyclodeaminase family protein [Pandoraea commovens]|uniref:Ornithine cyclodeaminase family protein n=1 Tax=Pandoraea commovens TaxID=2508289 RepID=A0ABY5QAN2_9BURK|nr:ornithine cyclodeaminase family protein [Pandoraea commovens]UVA77565.1 ornithine cyclodeaminase family protein [Pandoraea commovens]
MSATVSSPPVLLLDAAQIAALMPVADAIPVMSDMFGALAREQIHLPLRQIVRPPETLGAKGLLGMMPAFLSATVSGTSVYGAKVGTFFPGNSSHGKDPHQGCVLLMSGETGELLAVMNAAEITGIRTAAVTGLATRLLARHDASRLALIGAGHQAHWHLAALAAARPLQHVRVASRSLASAQAFVDKEQPNYGFRLEAAQSVEAAVRDADIVVTVTNSTDPVLQAEWIAPGAHVNLVGSSTPRHREADTSLMARAQLFVDRRESTINESGDYLAAAAEGRIGPDDLLAELGELVIRTHAGRTDAESVTLFKSLGMGAQDVALAAALYHRAQAGNVGVRATI